MKVELIIVPLFVGVINMQGQQPPSLTRHLQATALPITRLTSADENLNIMALPVGQGDATIIQCPGQYGGSLTRIENLNELYFHSLRVKQQILIQDKLCLLYI